MGNEWGSVVTNSDEVGGMTASIGVAGVGGVGCCSDSDAVGVCRWVGWECGSKIRAALEVSEYLELLLEVRASWVTVAGAEVDHLFTNVMSDGQKEDKVAINAQESSFIDRAEVCRGAEEVCSGWCKSWRDEVHACFV